MRVVNTTQLSAQNDLGCSDSDIAVTVFCIAFNHDLYLADTLEAIIRQQTDFRFEVVVHDDASTDKTVKIIRDFVREYPQHIRAILQTENQYSKGGFDPLCYAASSARGRYIAICEGDDKWIDDQKLQRQYDSLRKRPDIAISFHPAQLYECGKNTKKIYGYYGDQVKVISARELIGGSVVPTASIMISASAMRSLPDWFYSDAPVGDFYLRVIASAAGGALYLPETMSIYRAHNPGSWSTRVKSDPQKLLLNNEQHLAVCDRLNSHLNFQFSSDIAQFRCRLLFGRMAVFFKIGDFRGLITDCKRLFRDPRNLAIALFQTSKVIIRKPVQSWQSVSRNFSYSWSEKSKS